MAFHSSSLSFLGVPRRLSLVSIEEFREVLKHLNFCPSYGLKKPSPGPSPICIIFWKNVLIVLFRQNFFPFLLIRLGIWPVQSWFSIVLWKKRSVIAKHVVMVIELYMTRQAFHPAAASLRYLPPLASWSHILAKINRQCWTWSDVIPGEAWFNITHCFYKRPSTFSFYLTNLWIHLSENIIHPCLVY